MSVGKLLMKARILEYKKKNEENICKKMLEGKDCKMKELPEKYI